MDTPPADDGASDSARGPQPDVQLSFANERTFLAWERTALGLITAGLAITQLLPSFDFPGGRRLIGLPLTGFGRTDGAAGVTSLGLGMFSYVLAGWQARRRLAPGRVQHPAQPVDLLPLAIGVSVIGVAAFVLGLLFPA